MPPVAYEPSGAIAQEEAPTNDVKLPAAHNRHEVAPAEAEYDPIAQPMGTELALLEMYPGGVDKQLLAPCVLVYDPALQGV